MNHSSSLSSAVSISLGAAVLVGSITLGMVLRANWSGRTDQSWHDFEATGASRGELVYQLQCANCHGAEGRGDGEAAEKLRPPPRDFAARPWRFEPTRESIRRVIVDGIPGTAMPSARAAVQGTDLDALVEHVIGLAQPRTDGGSTSPEQQLASAARFQLARSEQMAPELRVSDAQGNSIALTDLRGKLVLINFWGVTCEHCLKKMPALESLAEKYRSRGLIVLHICADADDIAEAQSLASEAVPGVQVHVDDTGLAVSRFGVTALPTLWLVGSDQHVIATAQGGRDWLSPEMHAFLESHMPE